VLTTLSLALLLAASDPAPPRVNDEFLQNLEPDAVEAPPGPDADRALWRQLRDGTAFSTLQLARVAQLSFRLKYGRYFEELEARAKGPEGGEARERLDALRAAADRARQLIPRQPGVYQCRHALLDLETRMKGLPDPKAEADLPEARVAARACVDKMRTVLAAVTESAEGLDRAMTAADAHLKRAAPAIAAGQKVPSATDTLESMPAEKKP
jgi:hypothetical protein